MGDYCNFMYLFSVGAPPDNFLLFTDTRLSGIFRMDLTSNSYVQIPLSRNDNPISIDYDPVDGRIYWTDVGLKQIRSATIDGNSEKTVRILGSGKYLTFVVAIFFLF